MTEGRSDRWVKLHARILDSAVWNDMPVIYLKVFLHCILEANWEDNQWWTGREYVAVPRGSFVSSIVALAKEFKLTRQKMRTCLEMLAASRNLTIASRRGSTIGYSIITVTNYERYQGGDDSWQPLVSDAKQPLLNHCLTILIEDVEEKKSIDDTVVSSQAERVAAPVRKRAKRPAADPEQDAWFDEWYALYPRHEKRDRALAAFRKIVTSLELFDQAIQAVHQKLGGLNNPDPRYFRYPATWLNDKPWEEPPAPEQPTAVTTTKPANGAPPQTFAERNEQIRNEKFTARILRDIEEAKRVRHKPD